MNTILRTENEIYEITMLTQVNQEEIQTLCHSCNDYFIMSQGCKTIGNEAAEILSSIPPNNDIKDKSVIGIYNSSKKLVGLVDLIKNYPKEDTWIIGLMLIEPNERRQKIGQEIDKLIKTYISSKGGKAIHLGVLRENISGRKFWESQGYLKVSETKSKINGSLHEIDLMSFEMI